ncbi:toll/interleukin-1 receptor domain-containing protein [Amycolatopsis sp. NBC_01307]|uniref:toll/interleukin-1 receptor domain-containing protein n=1 Tax=Amycolatopsis sp. NBC_01307 TaxID=2903561 RepID=UPI002E1021FB|nr:toll/interleukin-1 receptor domain-containing protein [Amycolatopsis sp. NBC_01307]
MSETSGFWSYVHRDDAAEGERISQLARDVVSQFEMISGETISLFLDRDSMEWGDKWRAKIDTTLASVAFFVPIITPRYFMSTECRRELNFFARRANELGIPELVMPIKYIDFPGLTDDSPLDDSISLIKSFQWEDWTETRFCSRTSPEYRQAVARLAERMYRVNSALEATSVTVPKPVVPDAGGADDALGFVDIISQSEVAFPQWSATLEKLGKAITEIGEIMGVAGTAIQDGVKRAEPYSARLAILEEAAGQLEEPTTRIESLANAYSSQLHNVDEGISLILRMIPAEIASQTTSATDIRSFCDSLTGLAKAAAEGLGHIETMTEMLEQTEGMTRAIRPVVRRLRKSLTLLLEAREITQTWVTEIDKLSLPTAPA